MSIKKIKNRFLHILTLRRRSDTYIDLLYFFAFANIVLLISRCLPDAIATPSSIVGIVGGLLVWKQSNKKIRNTEGKTLPPIPVPEWGLKIGINHWGTFFGCLPLRRGGSRKIYLLLLVLWKGGIKLRKNNVIWRGKYLIIRYEEISEIRGTWPLFSSFLPVQGIVLHLRDGRRYWISTRDSDPPGNFYVLITIFQRHGIAIDNTVRQQMRESLGRYAAFQKNSYSGYYR